MRGFIYNYLHEKELVDIKFTTMVGEKSSRVMDELYYLGFDRCGLVLKPLKSPPTGFGLAYRCWHYNNILIYKTHSASFKQPIFFEASHFVPLSPLI